MPRHGLALRPRHALALGLLQGPTELLPVSSSAHTILVPLLARWPYGELPATLRKSFEVALHGGTALALALAMRAELSAALGELDARQAAVVALACIPPAGAGVAFDELQAPGAPHAVGEPGADEVAEHACGHHAKEREVVVGEARAGIGHREAREEHRRLGGDGHACALGEHQQEDRREPGIAYEVPGDVDQRLGDRGEHDHQRSHDSGASRGKDALGAPWARRAR